MKDEIIFIVLQVCLIASFLVIFFFSYVSDIENKIVQKQIEYLVDSFTDEQKYIITDPSVRQIIKNSIDNIQSPDLSQEDAEVEASNQQLENLAVQTVLIFLIIGIIIFLFYLLSSMLQGNVKGPIKILTTSIIILIAVGATEVTFLDGISRNYISADPNYFRMKILQQLKNFADSNLSPHQ